MNKGWEARMNKGKKCSLPLLLHESWKFALMETFQNKGNSAKKLQGKIGDLWLPQPFLLDSS